MKKEDSASSGHTRILLASTSPRRRELMSLGDWNFTISASNVDESQHPGERPAAYVLRLAEAKARAADVDPESADVIVAADTIVVDNGQLLGKPRDAADAVLMLRQLRGRVHEVYTGLAVIHTRTGQLWNDLCVTSVPMRDYNDVEIDNYVRSGDPLDKAGAYAVQHEEFHPVAGLRGCFASVMGLPLCHLLRLLAKMRLVQKGELPARCQKHLEYACPVSDAILRYEQAG
ncbi:MAG TPA: Maf family protein [Anaerolineales bacterium]|nr:Maf family protein [Anaerolineales bacterium]